MRNPGKMEERIKATNKAKQEGFEQRIIAEYDGKKYTADDYQEIVQGIIRSTNIPSKWLEYYKELDYHAKKLKELGIENAPYGGFIEYWLQYLMRNGKYEWAADQLYTIFSRNDKKEEAIWALEAGVAEFEKRNDCAPHYWYHLINDYYYNKIDELEDNDYINAQYLMNTTGKWYKKGVEAGCDPEILEGRIWSERPVDFSSNIGRTKRTGCYIATAIYGSYDCPEVWTLRRFRDDILAKTSLGVYFIKVYYSASPKLVNKFGSNEAFTKIFKVVLDRIVKCLNEKGVSNTYYVDK